MVGTITKYRALLNKAMDDTIVTDGKGSESGGIEKAIELVSREALGCDNRGGEVIFIGNGGSAAICNHCAVDWWKNGEVKTRIFYGDSQLTCLANDYGYEHVFSKPVGDYGKKDDLLIAISSSGKSANILYGVKAARDIGMKVITLSGFSGDNPLRSMGDINIYVPSMEYGFVELVHQIILHAVSDSFEEMRSLNQITLD